MLTPQFVLPLHHELVIDLFAGGGGASTGIEQAIGRPVDVAINHDPETAQKYTTMPQSFETWLRGRLAIDAAKGGGGNG